MTQAKDSGFVLPLARLRNWVPGLLLLGLSVLAYLPVTRSGFIWDDDAHLTQNPCIVGPLGLKDVWTSAHARICPLVQTTFWVLHRLWGLNPMPYHLVNVLWHAAAALVLWRVLLRLKVRGAWLGAALWALHPVQVESVAWITEMKNTQSGLFFLLCVLCFCKSRATPTPDEPKNRARFYYALTLLFGAMAMASKSSTVVLPLVLGLCAWWLEGRWRWGNLIGLSPLLLLAAGTGVLSIWTQKLEGGGDGEKWALNGLERLVVAGRALWFYLGKLVWPHPLMIIYPRWEITTAGVAPWLPLIAAAGLSALLWAKRAAWNGAGRGLWLSWSYFVLALLPVLGLLNHGFLRYTHVGDHFQYLASMGPLALAGAGISAGLHSLKNSPRWLQPALCSLLLLGLGALTWRQCAVYQNEEILWSATIPQNPSCWVAHNNLGNDLLKKGRVDEALTHFENALEVYPGSEDAHNNLGNILLKKGRLDEALAHYRTALEIKPDYAAACTNLGLALQQTGRLDEAMAHFQKALEVDPGYAEAHYNIGVLLGQIGRPEDALAHYQKAIEINPGFAEAHNNLGAALRQKGRIEEALGHFEKAVELNPDSAEFHYNLGNILGQKDRAEEALAHYQKAIEINPGFAQAYGDLGNVLLQKGRLQEALAHYEKALEISPGFADAHHNLGVLLLQQGQLDEALGHFEKALQINPSSVEAHKNLASLLQQKGRLEEAATHYQKAIEINSEDAEALNNLALVLAASDKAELRDGVRAVALAQQADRLTGGGNPSVLATLAAALAEAGDFFGASETLQRAIPMAEAQGNPALADLLREHLKLYQRGEPLRVGP